MGQNFGESEKDSKTQGKNRGGPRVERSTEYVGKAESATYKNCPGKHNVQRPTEGGMGGGRDHVSTRRSGSPTAGSRKRARNEPRKICHEANIPQTQQTRHKNNASKKINTKGKQGAHARSFSRTKVGLKGGKPQTPSTLRRPPKRHKKK